MQLRTVSNNEAEAQRKENKMSEDESKSLDSLVGIHVIIEDYESGEEDDSIGE